MQIATTLLLVVIIGLFLATRYLAWQVERWYPAIGEFADVGGARLHYADVAGNDPARLPVVFIHGASGNLRDLMVPVVRFLSKGDRTHGRLIFVDRPGHGYSDRASVENMALPEKQAEFIEALLAQLGIERAIIAGHSLGGSVAAALAVNHPARAAGLVFIAPATHPWPGGDVTWYYELSVKPLVGRLFSELVAVPAGHLRYREAVRGVFSPNRVPDDYHEIAGNRLVLRPDVFRYNSEDVSGLYDAVSEMAPRYREIKAPTSIITGDSDDVVLAEIHSKGLERDIDGSKLIWLENTGHAPAWSHPEVIWSEIERIQNIAGEVATDHNSVEKKLGAS